MVHCVAHMVSAVQGQVLMAPVTVMMVMPAKNARWRASVVIMESVTSLTPTRIANAIQMIHVATGKAQYAQNHLRFSSNPTDAKLVINVCPHTLVNCVWTNAQMVMSGLMANASVMTIGRARCVILSVLPMQMVKYVRQKGSVRLLVHVNALMITMEAYAVSFAPLMTAVVEMLMRTGFAQIRAPVSA